MADAPEPTPAPREKPKAAPTPKAAPATEPGKGASAVEQAIASLKSAAKDSSQLQRVMDDIARLDAKTVKIIAANYAVAGQPATKKKALELIRRAWANMQRAEQKAEVSALSLIHI